MLLEWGRWWTEFRRGCVVIPQRHRDHGVKLEPAMIPSAAFVEIVERSRVQIHGFKSVSILL